MGFINGEIKDVIVSPQKLKKYFDDRGWLAELFRHDDLTKSFIPRCHIFHYKARHSARSARNTSIKRTFSVHRAVDLQHANVDNRLIRELYAYDVVDAGVESRWSSACRKALFTATKT